MKLEEIQTVITRSAALRIPRFTTDDRGGKKIERLEDYILLTAHMRGDLEDAWRYASRVVSTQTEEWEELESLAPYKTERARNVERRLVRPDLYGSLRDARQMKLEIERQIKRLEKDYEAASRAYTFITGNS